MDNGLMEVALKCKLLCLISLALLLSLNGCGANYFTATTEASYDAKTGSWSYKSNKNQENFEAKIAEFKDGRQVLEVKTTATTPEAAIAAAMASFSKAIDALTLLVQQATAAAKTGAAAGS